MYRPWVAVKLPKAPHHRDSDASPESLDPDAVFTNVHGRGGELVHPRRFVAQVTAQANGDPSAWPALWARLRALVARALAAAHAAAFDDAAADDSPPPCVPPVDAAARARGARRACFGRSCALAVVAFDVIVDQALRPWLIEANENPGWGFWHRLVPVLAEEAVEGSEEDDRGSFGDDLLRWLLDRASRDAGERMGDRHGFEELDFDQ